MKGGQRHGLSSEEPPSPPLSSDSKMFKATLFVITAFLTSALAFQGDATWYNTGLGACGAWSVDTDLVVALNPADYAGGANCYKHISVYYGDKYTDATIVDLCPGCGNKAIDLSPAAFSKLANKDVGRISVGWHFA